MDLCNDWAENVTANTGQTVIQVIKNCGLPQGAELSPKLWCLVADSLLQWLYVQGIFRLGFANDGTILIVGRVMITISI